MAKHLTPLIGLAVVVALALAAVFGSMSLANPAMAAIGQSADAELTERTFSPQANPRTAYVGRPDTIDLTDYISGTGMTHIGVSEPGPVADRLGITDGTSDLDYTAVDLDHDDVATTDPIGVAVLEIGTDGEAEIVVTPADDTESSDASITLYAMDGATAADAITAVDAVKITFNIMASRAATPKTGATDAGLVLYREFSQEVDLLQYVNDGVGSGKVASITLPDESGLPTGVTDYPAGTTRAADGSDDLTLKPDDDGKILVTLNTTDALLPVPDSANYTFTANLSDATPDTIDVELFISVVNSTSVTARADMDIPDLTGDMSIETGGSATVELLDDMDMHKYFAPGMGKGAMVTYTVDSEDDGIVRTRIRQSTGVITLLARDVLETVEITVTATDDGGGTAMKSFLVAVTEPGAPPMPGVVEMQEAPQSLMVMPSMAAGAKVPTIGSVDVMWSAPTSLPEGKMVMAYEIRSDQQADWTRVAMADLTMANGMYSYMLMGLADGEVHNIQVRAVYDDDDATTMDVDETTTGPVATYTVLLAAAPTFAADDLEPGKNSWYTLQYSINKVFNGGADTMTIKLEGFGVPSSISNNGIAIVATEPASSNNFDADPESKDYNSIEEITFNPASIAVDGKEITMTFPDVRPEGDITKKSFDAGTNFKVIIYQSAGVSNPTASRVYGGNGSNGSARGSANEDREIFVTFSGVNVPAKMWLSKSATSGDGVLVPRLVQLSEEDGGLGDMVTATGLGFENGGTMHFFVDNHKDALGKVIGPNGRLNSGEDVLCSVASVSGNMGSCEFEITTPTFDTGLNYVNAVDGDGKIATDAEGGDNEFTLKASIKATPAGGSPGEIMQVQLVSFPGGAPISMVKLSGNYVCGGVPPGMTSTVTCGSLGFGNVGTQGTASIGVTVPNWAVAGVQELFVAAGGEDDDTKVTIAGPRIVPTPQTVVANQRVSLVGTGFSPRSTIGRVAAGQRQIARISIGGDDIGWPKVNNGRVVEVDDGGNWSASVDLPLSEATTGTGERLIRITDSMGRTGSVRVTLAARDFDITPPEGRVGTLAVVRGVGYPSKNDEGESFTVDVIYQVQEGTSTRVSVVPDASGRFEVQVRIPTTAAIPSTNQVEVKFELADGTEVLENKQHIVPEGIINLSETSGGPGSMVTVSGEGYKAFVNVDSVKIGTFDITPSPKPHTDGNGMMEFAILVPGIDVGIQTIEVQVGGTTSSTGFTVTESGVNPGDIVAVAKGIEDLGDNLVSVWNFNNDTKVWSFYDPTLAEGNTLTHMITGETYLIRIKADQEVILNRDTRNLTCVGSNCWNQVVW